MSDPQELDYLSVLKAVQEIPFGVGKKLLVDFLRGDEENESIKRNKLHSLDHFASLFYEQQELFSLIDSLIKNNLLEHVGIPSNPHVKVLELSEKGKQEIDNPSFYKKKLAYQYKEHKTEITEKDRTLFAALDHFLNKYNEEQKKAIISDGSHLLCIAGAGSGKTTVLTKRIEFLVTYRSVPAEKILAITFTRKARQEMMQRLSHYPQLSGVRIETFNSFCEKILQQHEAKLYSQPMRVLTYKDKITLLQNGLAYLKIDLDIALDRYFTFAQQRGKTPEQLTATLMNDLFFVRDYCKFKNMPLDNSMFTQMDGKHTRSAQMVLDLCVYFDKEMKKQGIRDFADQLLDAIQLFESSTDLIPAFDHILIDEFQDVNSTQIHLVDLLKAPHLFVVGDPRQSIYGWRGSDIQYILDFTEKYADAQTITLLKNYRSTQPLVQLMNASIRHMKLPGLEAAQEGEKKMYLCPLDSEQAEQTFIVNTLADTSFPLHEVFVLARTNRQLNELSEKLKIKKIKHTVRSDDSPRTEQIQEGHVTLATVHAIKGLEARLVFVMGCTAQFFPSQGSEHPVIEMVKVDEYDQEEEERRLFYVAISRAREVLYLTHGTTTPTSYITNEMRHLLERKTVDSSLYDSVNLSLNAAGDVVSRLKHWRLNISKSQNIPSYMILSDRSIIEISQQMPLTSDDLEDIHGLGPTKIKKYGEEILRLVQGA